MNNKSEMKFIRTTNVETAHKLRHMGYTELTDSDNKFFCFLNDGKQLNFNAEENGIVYTNVLCI